MLRLLISQTKKHKAVNHLLAKPLEQIVPKDFKGRFSAWWEGVDYVPSPHDPSEEGIHSDEPGEDPFDGVSEALVAMAFAQGLWGEGYLGPGDATHYTDLIKNLSLSNEKSLCVLGSGLAGAAREIVRETDVWVTCYESRKIAVEESHRQCMIQGMGKKIKINAYDPETVELPEEKFNSIVSFEEFLFVQNKARLIEGASTALKFTGSLLLTDYIVLKDDLSSESLAAMFPRLWGDAKLWKVDQYKACFEESGLTPRVSEDVTARYVKMIEQGWSQWRRLLDTLKGRDMSSAQEAAILRMIGTQAAVWANRLEALNAGDIGVYRLLALKPSAPVR